MENKKELVVSRAFKAVFYNESRNQFSRSTLGFILCMMVALLSVIAAWFLILMDFFKNNPGPADKDVHKFAESMGIDPDKFEGQVYAILGSFLGAGRAKEKNITEKDVSAEELKKGIKVEMEHTTDPILSARIALDHLAEIPDYYTRLIKMEKEAGIED